MTPSAQSEGWNPKWLAFLGEKGLTTDQADAMERDKRISLNAEFMVYNSSGSIYPTPAKRKRGRPSTGFDKKAYDRKYHADKRASRSQAKPKEE